MTDITQYIAELRREVAMRSSVYPGRVMARKMSQAAADKKTEIMKSVLIIFEAAEWLGIEPQEIKLPFYEPDGDPFPITTLEPHIKECAIEIEWRVHRLERSNMGASSRQVAMQQLQLFKHILQILQTIQARHFPVQTSLF